LLELCRRGRVSFWEREGRRGETHFFASSRFSIGLLKKGFDERRATMVTIGSRQRNIAARTSICLQARGRKISSMFGEENGHSRRWERKTDLR
jgi:hypothetical protein